MLTQQQDAGLDSSLSLLAHSQGVICIKRMNFFDYAQLIILFGLPLAWPFILSLYICHKVKPKFIFGEFFLYSLAGLGVMVVLFILAFLVNYGLELSGHHCANYELVGKTILCSYTFLGFSNWFQSYLVLIPMYLSLVMTTFWFKKHASI